MTLRSTASSTQSGDISSDVAGGRPIDAGMDLASTKAQPLQIIGVERSHDTLLKILETKSPAKILDVPAGQGVLAAYLKEKGWDVHAADIDPGNFRLAGVPFTQVNLNRKLPFADSSFDAVSCVNGLHRLMFPEIAIREFARMLRAEGTLYINLNNYSSIRKRLRFLLTGTIDQALESQECIQTIDDPEANIRLPLMYPRLHSMLQRSGFNVVDVKPAAISTLDRLLRPAALLVQVAGHTFPSSYRDRLGLPAGNISTVLGGGAYFFVEATKASIAGSGN